MKKYLVIIIILFLHLNSFCQLLSLNDLQYLYHHDIESCDSYLQKRGFSVFRSKASDDGLHYTTGWSCKKHPEIQNDNEPFAFVAKYSKFANDGEVGYQLVKDNSNCNIIREQCKAQGFKLIKTESDEKNYLCYTYISSKYKIMLCSGENSHYEHECYFTLIGLEE